MVSCRSTCCAGTCARRSAQCGASLRKVRKRGATDIWDRGLDCGLRIDDHDLRCKLTFWPVPCPHTHTLALPQLTDTRPPKCFHMHEDVRRIRPAGDKSIAFAPVEPLHSCIEWRTFR